MKKILPYLFLAGFVLQSFSVAAQNTIQGVVLDKDKQETLPGAVITFKPVAQDDILAYKITDNEGRFSQNIPKENDSIRVIVSILGYKTRSFSILNKSQELKIQLETSEIELKGVSVRAPNIRKQNDTLHYNVAGFKSAQDRYLGDVLKKLPGVEVTNTGSIRYNGEPINNFYIEDLNLLGNKYSLATNNISVDDVSNVQVIENHQGVRALENIAFSDRAAINIKLKKNRMIKPIGTVDWGLGGEPLLWNGKLFTMLIAPKKQALVTYKTSNTGLDLTKELTEHPMSINELTALPPSDLFFSIAYNNLPLSEKRYLFNKTHMVSINNLWKITEYNQLRINADYVYDERSQEVDQNYKYYLDTLLVKDIDEINRLKNYNNAADLKFTYTDNSPGHFTENVLRFNGKWVTENSSITGTNKVFQSYSIPLFYVQNKLNYTKRNGNKVFRFNSFARYSNQPQRLAVSLDSMIYEEQNIRQNATRALFYTENNTSWSHRFSMVSRVSVDFELRASLEDLNTEMNFVPFTERALFNDIRKNQFNYIVSPSYVYDNSIFRASFSLPINFIDLYVNNRSLNEKNHYNHILINPAIGLSYKFNELLNSYLNVSHRNDIGDIFDFANGVIMSDYRYFREGSGIMEKRSTQNYSWRLVFRDAISTVFFNIQLSYRPTKRSLMSERTFIEKYSISKRQELDNKRDIRSAQFQIGKYFDKLKSNISISANYNQTNYDQKQQNSLAYSLNSLQ